MIPIPKRALLVLAAAVAVIVILAVALTGLFPAKAILAQIVVVDPSGVPHTVVSGSVPAGSFVQIGGITVSQVYMTVTFTASSQQYSKYTLNPGSSPVAQNGNTGAITSSGSAFAVAFVQLTNANGLPNIAICGTSSAVVPASYITQLSAGTAYNMGQTVFGTAGPVVSLTSSSLIGWASANGCTGTGSYVLQFGVQVAITAVGQGVLPQAQYNGAWGVSVSVLAGSITITGSVTGGSN